MIIGFYGSLWSGVAARGRLCAALVSVLAAACGGAPPAGEPHSALDVAPAVSQAGESVYFGSVFALDGTLAQPSFVYERRVAEQPRGLRSTHVTRDPSGGIAIAEAATHSRDYELYEYELYTNQLGKSGSIRSDAGQLRFELRDGERTRTAVEDVTDPVVVGPTFVGYILRHLPALRAGEVLPVRLAIPDRLETLGFELQVEDSPQPGQTRVSASPSSFLISLALDPLHFTFDDASGKLLRLQGRVPPKLWRNGWKDLDARVEYRYVALAYR